MKVVGSLDLRAELHVVDSSASLSLSTLGISCETGAVLTRVSTHVTTDSSFLENTALGVRVTSALS